MEFLLINGVTFGYVSIEALLYYTSGTGGPHNYAWVGLSWTKIGVALTLRTVFVLVRMDQSTV